MRITRSGPPQIAEQLLAQLRRFGVVEPGGGLVEHQDLGLAAPARGRSPAASACHRAGCRPRPRRRPRGRSGAARRGTARRAAPSMARPRRGSSSSAAGRRKSRRNRQTSRFSQRRHAVEQPDVLIGAGNARHGDLVLLQAFELDLVEQDAARRRRCRSRRHVDQRRLAGAVRPDDRVDAAGLEGEADIVDRDQRAEPLADMLEAQHQRQPSRRISQAGL